MSEPTEMTPQDLMVAACLELAGHDVRDGRPVFRTPRLTYADGSAVPDLPVVAYERRWLGEVARDA